VWARKGLTVSERTPKKMPPLPAGIQRQMVQHGARPRFKTVAVRDSDPIRFAKKHEDTLNAFVAGGWNVTGMMQRGDSLIITGQRIEVGPPPQEEESEEEPFFALPESSTDDGHIEIVYSFLERGKHRSVSCHSMPDAMNRVREHIQEQDASILPTQITIMSVTSYEPLKDFSVLNRLYPPTR
jgi:hypothetical protein